MKDAKKVIDNLTNAEMHVHPIDGPVPFHVANWDTHFIMKDADIVHVGNLKTIEQFALRLSI